MSEPTTVNQTATIANKALSVGTSVAEGVALAAISVEAPWFAALLKVPVLGSMIQSFVTWIGSFFYKAAAEMATKLIIEIQTGLETSAVNSAFDDAQKAIASNDQTKIAQASSDLDAAFGNLIHSDGVAVP